MNKLTLISLLVCLLSLQSWGQNPLISHIYAADPSAHVWPADTTILWIYASHDVPGTNHHATMFDYHVFSTSDLLTWTDHGRVLSVDDVDWAISHAWAIDAVYWRDSYYLLFCMREKSTGIFRTGVAVSDRPEGPFANIGFIKGVDWGQDPAIFVDDDNTPYLFWGLNKTCFAAQLNDDLMSIVPETKVELTHQLFEVFEGPWVHKFRGKYYLSYPALPDGQWPEVMKYAVADQPLGPYQYKGTYIAEFDGRSGTNHGSIVNYKGNWMAFYHSAWLSGGMSEVRNLMADYLYYNIDGTIKPIVPTRDGLAKGKPTSSVIKLEAESAPKQGGRLMETSIEKVQDGFSGRGYVTGFNNSEKYVQVLVQVAESQQYSLKVRYGAKNDISVRIQVNEIIFNGSTSDWHKIILPKSDNFTNFEMGVVNLKTGDNIIKVMADNEGFMLDYFLLEPINKNKLN